MDNIVISVIMPTLNSARTIEESLKSIRNQHFDQGKVEILIIDAGSTDETINIANKYDCTILQNERKLPEFAKQIGFEKARGEWAIFIDSDEMFTNMDSFSERIILLNKYPKIKNLVSTGMRCKQGEIGINRYANRIADPFSWFVYRFNGYDRMKSMKKAFHHKQVGNAEVFSFKKSDYIPLYDALGNTFHLETARYIYEKENRPDNFVANIFENMAVETGYVAILYDDYVVHDPGLTEKIYKSKMIWRIKNNLFNDEGVGFSGRLKRKGYLTKRKYLYILYSVTLIPVLLDGISLSIENKDIYMMKHIFWNEFVFFNIIFYVLLKMLHVPVKKLEKYGK